MLVIGSSILVRNKMAKRGRGIVIDKNNLLSKTTSPKVILMGGSNVCYGINSALLQDSLHMPVIDMAINADVGMMFYYNQVKPYINKGDIVIGIPEYAAYAEYKLYGDVSMYQLCVVQPSNMRFLSKEQWLRFPRFAGDIVKENYNAFTSDANSDVANGRKFYNSFGDYEGHKDKPTGLSISKPIANKNKTDWSISPSLISMIKMFSVFCNQKGAVYLHSYPVFLRSSYKQDWGNKIEKQFQDIHLLNRPDEYLFSGDSLYDSDNHMLYKYRNTRTERLAKNVKFFLQNQGLNGEQ